MKGFVLSCFVFFIIYLGLFPSTVSSQECISPCAMSFTACSIIDYNVYVPNVADEQAREAQIANFYQTIQALNAPPACADAVVRLLCSALHPSCVDNTTAVPLQTCSRMCLDVQAACGALTGYIPREWRPLAQQCDNETLFSVTPGDSCSFLNNTVSTCDDDNGGSVPQIRWAGACQALDPSQAPEVAEICGAFAPKTIFVPANLPDAQTRIAADPNVIETARRIHSAMHIIPLGCFKRYAAVLCPLVYPPCYEYNVSVPGFSSPVSVSVGPTICRDFCYAASDECSDYFHRAGVQNILPVCDAPEMVDKYTAGSTFNITIDASRNLTVEVPCINQIFPNDAFAPFAIPEVTCPHETARKTVITDADPICGMKCPDASYTNKEWRVLIALTQAGSAISLFCMFFLIVSYIVKYEKRKFPATLHLNEFAATFMFSLSFLLGGTHPEKNVWCFDEGTYATQDNNSTCAVQGFFFIFFGISLAAWCAVISFSMFYTVVIKKSKDAISRLHKFNKWFYVFGWGVPLIFGIAALGSKRIGYGPPLAWCFIRFGGFGFNDGFSRDYPLFYIPIGVLFVAIMIMFFMTIGTIMITYRHQSSAAKDNKVFLTAQIRVFIFIFVIVAICITYFEWRFQIEAENQKSDRLAVGEQWTFCKLKLELNLTKIEVDGDMCSGDTNPSRIDFGHTAFESFLLSGIGILIFIAFGSDPGIFKHWGSIIILLFKGNYKELKYLILDGKDGNRSRASTYNTGSKGTSKNSSNNKSSNSNSDNSPNTSVEMTSASFSGAETTKSKEVFEI